MVSTDSVPVTEGGGAAQYAMQDHHHLGLVAGMVDELRLVELIDSLVPQDRGQRNLSMDLPAGEGDGPERPGVRAEDAVPDAPVFPGHAG